MAANATYKWPMTDRLEGYVSAAYQHIGDRYTQIADQRTGFGTFDIRIAPPPNGYGDPTTTGQVAARS